MDDEDKQVITGKEEFSLPADADHQEEQVPVPTDADRAVKSTTAPADDEIKYSILQRLSRYMARNPWTHFSIAMVIAVALSVIGFVVGNFSPAIDNAGWNSRGTLISNRQTQMLLVSRNSYLLAAGDSHWDELLNNVQPGWETTEGDGGRRLSDVDNMPRPFAYGTADPTKSDSHLRQEVPFQLPDELKRRLQQSALTGGLQDCNVQWYSDGSMTYFEHLWPVWKTTKPTISVLDSQVIRDICVAEQNTIEVLESEGLCTAECSGQRCLPPFSVVFFARLTVNDIDFTMSCDELGTAWEAYAAASESELAVCADALNQNGVKSEDPLPDSCPYGFSPTLVDKAFGSNSPNSLYTSSIFNTVEDTNKLFKVAGGFERAGRSSVVRGAYDTQYEAFVNYQVDNSLLNDMILAMGSAGITALAVLVHTRSPWLTIIGLIQIILSFPLAYFFYTFPGQLEFFPFLNFIGVFVVFALGADDIFVAVDKWRNARLDDKNGSTEDIACVALPSAAESMFYTSVTTAVAFFGTAVCPVAPLKCFAIFCGLLVSFDYIMCVVIVFPALCLYDKWKTSGDRNCFVSCHSCHKYEDHGPDLDGEESKPSLIRRILTTCYNGLHFVRWPLLVCCFAALVVSAYFGSGLSLPDSADVRLLNPKTSQYEQNFQWRLNLLFDALSKKGGSAGYVIWGVEPADTGNHNNPTEWSQLKLDDSFNPSTEDAQLYLAGFCDDFFAEDFAEKTDPDYVCSMNQFDLYLQEQANSTSPDSNYVNFCNGATGLPLPQEDFDTCITAWAQLTGATNILSRNGVVEIIFVKFQARVRFDSPYDALNKEWSMIEKWMSTERAVAPSGLKGMYHSSMDFCK
jgi:Sterol-sensing domain of SREBP cleavage-activation